MIIKRTIKFSIRSYQNAGSRIRMRVSYDGNRLDFQTGIILNKDNWDERQQRVLPSNSNATLANDLNDHLSQMMADMIAVFRDFELQQVVPTASALRSAFKKRTTPQSQSKAEGLEKDRFVTVQQTDIKDGKTKIRDLWKSYDEFVKVNGKLNDWTPATYEKFAALRNHLSGFDKKLCFAKFNEDGIASFIDYLGKKGMKNSTINKQLGFLRWFLRWCYERGYHANHTFEYFKPKLKNAAKRVIFLTQEELGRVETLKIPSKYASLESVRDVFLFCCYTGLRYSDAYNLTWDDIHNGKIEIVTVKTADRIQIELNNKSQAILSKYSDIHFPGRKVLPVISNQKMNQRLHSLCKLAGIDEPIKTTHYEGNSRVDEVKPKYKLVGTHCGRRTFICTALAKGIPPSVVMKWTGHSDYKAMKPYIDIADEVKSSYMKQFDT
ncbi:MAG: tyrosine-type recombinase/integrase [Prevotella sp.]|jgi:integrase|nr:tyrosine-type recombinase/integrase [Prevotella sp.]